MESDELGYTLLGLGDSSVATEVTVYVSLLDSKTGTLHTHRMNWCFDAWSIGTNPVELVWLGPTPFILR